MIVCLLGPSAAGKSTLAKELERRYPERFARVPVDYFFVARPEGMPVAQFLSHPLGYDWDAVDRALSAHGRRRTTPDCDFERFVRRSDAGGLAISDAPVYVLDGMRPHPRCDFLVMLDLDASVQRQRLAERDIRWGTRVASRTAQLTSTFKAGLAQLPRQPDLRLQATATVDANAQRVIEALADIAAPISR